MNTSAESASTLDAGSGTNGRADEPPTVSTRTWTLLAAIPAICLWLSGPPTGFWPAALIALTPLMLIANMDQRISKRRYLILYLAGFAYWLLALQGLRFAHPLIVPMWILMAAYLAVYPLLFVLALRAFRDRPLMLALLSPVIWVGGEWVRNYLLTGISVAMLGHALAEVPIMIQIADLAGTYAVSFVLASCSAAVFALIRWYQLRDSANSKRLFVPFMIAIALVAATTWYGNYRLGQPLQDGQTTFALIGRAESIEFEQNEERSLELFHGCLRQTAQAVQSANQSLDVVVWPESMFTAGLPWIDGQASQQAADKLEYTPEQLNELCEMRRDQFLFRASSIMQNLAIMLPENQTLPDLMVGCAVVSYETGIDGYNGLIHLDSEGKVVQWYAKNHLVMFGEYVPLLTSLPVIKHWIPDGLGLSTGKGAAAMQVGEATVLPNICIETAVERVAINQLRELRGQDNQPTPTVIVTVTNDGWFDDSSVVQHHKRCAQLLAVACRKPLLSAANNGPTCWIDSCGRIVEEVQQGQEGTLIARPQIDSRQSAVLTFADYPAAVCGLAFLGTLVISCFGVRHVF
ncbi:MAG: apolipoprotein N-acyltransferase [Geminicoccus sp.]|nr:apolipoprotein N-acyltransferase [Geminicoccus sp.]